MLVVVWGYQQNQLIFGTGECFFARKREKKVSVFFKAFWGCFCAFLGCFLRFLGCFCAFGFWFLVFFFARQRDFFWGVVNFLGGTTPKRGIPALYARQPGLSALVFSDVKTPIWAIGRLHTGCCCEASRSGALAGERRSRRRRSLWLLHRDHCAVRGSSHRKRRRATGRGDWDKMGKRGRRETGCRCRRRGRADSGQLGAYYTGARSSLVGFSANV